MTVLTDVDRLIVAQAVARSRRGMSRDGITAPTQQRPRATVRPRRNVTAPTYTSNPAFFTGLCLYCGAPTRQSRACDGHTDLLDLDGPMMAAVTCDTTGSGRKPVGGSAAGARREPS